MLTTIVLILGIGAVILVHELGHFLAARYAGVRVETFSIGFGPKLVRLRRGDTVYCISLIPLGGYVKMAGEAVGEGSGAPDELNAKSVGQRFVIFAAGVVMNFLFALVLFSLVFAVGVPFRAPVIGKVLRGGPAWEAGLPEGAEVVRAGGAEVLSFPDLSVAVALGGSEILIEAIPPGEQAPRSYRIRPIYDQASGFRQILVDGAVEERIVLEVEPGSPAAQAGIQDGDLLLAIDGVPAAGGPTLDLAEGADPARPRRFTVARPGPAGPIDPRTVELQPRIVPGPSQIGVRAVSRRVQALRSWVPAVGRSGLLVGDIVLEAAGKPIYSFQELESALAGAAGEVPIKVLRRPGTSESGAYAERLLAISLSGPEETRAFLDGVALDVDRTVLEPLPGTPAERAGVARGDRVLTIDSRPVQDWSELRRAIADAGQAPLTLEVDRGGRVLSLKLSPEALPAADFGLKPLVPYMHRPIKASGPVAAMALGVRTSLGVLKQVYLSLQRVLSGQVAAKNLGGPVMIVTTSHTLLQQGLMKFLWFLAVISINLAFLNILPIPILDGGHLLFLLIEKIKGSPVSERVMLYAQVTGLVLILGLVLFVTYNDIQRLFP